MYAVWDMEIAELFFTWFRPSQFTQSVKIRPA